MKNIIEKMIDKLVEDDEEVGGQPVGEVEDEIDDEGEEGKELTDDEAVVVEEFIQWKLDEFWEGMKEQVADFIIDQTSVNAADVARTLASDVINKFQMTETKGE